MMEISIPTVHDDSLAPEGKHVLSAIVQFAPYAKGGWGEGRLKQIALEQLEHYAPGIGSQVLASELTPR